MTSGKHGTRFKGDVRGRGAARRIAGVLGTVVVVVLLGLAILLVGIPHAMGGTSLTVLSASMEPDIAPGDVVVTKGFGPADADHLKIGDVIVFLPYPNDSLVVTHRIVGITGTSEGRSFTTKGDANKTVDPWGPVSPRQIRGVMLFHVPALGYVRQWSGGNFRYIVAGVAAVLIGYGVVSVGLAFKRRNGSGSTGETDA